MHVDWCPSASAVSGTPVEPGEEEVQQKPVNILLLWILLRAAPDKNVWPLHSQSACSQVSAVLFYARTAKFVRAQTCDGDMHDEIGKNLPLAKIYHWYPELHTWIVYVYD